LGGKRIYISGDTDDIPEMRALKNIDVAFLCMIPPYTMSVDQAADAVKAFRPKVVFPYHYQNSDVQRFKFLVEQSVPGTEVKLDNWYPLSN
jgi:L-ascorbate metabolism protein UlaG (beta-lactamase superfamily)